MANQTLNDNLAIRMVSTPATYAAAAVNGSWINMTGYRRCLFVPMVGELDANLAVAVYQATDASGTSEAALSGLSNTFHNGSDESRVGLIEVRDVDLTDGFSYVTVKVTPAATDGYSCIAILSEPVEAPVLNGTANGVAFNTGE